MMSIMNKYLSLASHRYNEFESRERIALLLLAAFLSLVVLYLMVWSPINNFAADSKRDRDRFLGLYQYFSSTLDEAKSVAGNPKSPQATGQSLLTEVSRSAQRLGISPSRMQPEGSDAVSVWFDKVVFTQLMLWIERMESEQGIVVRQITLERRDVSGEVSARVLLRN